LLDSQETPVYVPLPPGVDKCTQIPRYDWNLHDYDIEVEPILQSLVGRCLEQSRIELIEDYEQEQYKLKRVGGLFYPETIRDKAERRADEDSET
jgi:hypothetical protein